MGTTNFAAILEMEKAARNARAEFEEMNPEQWQPVVKIGHGTFHGPCYDTRAEAVRDVQTAREKGLVGFIVRIQTVGFVLREGE